MNPPLREAEDIERICEALSDGTIEAIATDHAPHHYETKEREFDDAPFGVVGLETALALGVTRLVQPGHLTLPGLIRRMSTEPARIFHLQGGTLRRGARADIVVFDPEARWIVDPGDFRSKSRNSPFAGWQLQARVERTYVGGRLVYPDGAP